MSPQAERAFVLRQFVALRRSGLGALEVLTRLGDVLPAGEPKRACAEASQRLLSPTPPTTSDDLVRVLSTPGDDLSGAGALTLALDLELELEAARRATMRLMQLFFAAPILLLALAGRLGFGAELAPGNVPPASQLLFEVGGVMRWAGLPLAALGVFALERWRSVPVLGADRLRDARALLLAAAAAEPGAVLSSLAVGDAARALARVLAQRGPARDALVLVARRLEREGRRQVELQRAVAAVVPGLILLGFIGGVLTAAYLPIFSIAGSIK